MKSIPLIFLHAALCFSGCGREHEQASMQSFNTNIVLKVSVLQSGKILANAGEVGLNDLDTRMSEIKSQNGVVWYYRESGQGEPPPAAMEVMKLIVKHRLPVSMSSKPDFSDTVDAHGNSCPRK
jgi:hypothetical protein